MKKPISILSILLFLFFSGCSNTSSDNSNITDVKKTSLKVANQSSADLKNVTWMNILFSNNAAADFLMGSTVEKEVPQEGVSYIYFTRKSDGLIARTSSTVVVAKNVAEQFIFTDNTVVVEISNTENTGTLKNIRKTVQSLKLINQSSVDLKNVKWMNVLFSNNTASDFLAGSTVKQELPEAGSGYIYFTRKSDGLELRTPDIVTVKKNTEIEFVFADNMIVVEIENPANTEVINNIQKSVTKLKVINNTAAYILEPTWNQILFETVANSKYMEPGTSVEKKIASWSGYITFKIAGDTTAWRTIEQISINNFESKTFTFEADTQATQVKNTSIVKTLKELLAPKQTPVNIVTSFISDSSVTLSWDAVAGATGYKIYTSNLKTSLTATFLKEASITSSYIENLANITDFFFWITATNAYGESDFSHLKLVTFKTYTVGSVGPAGGYVFYDKGNRTGGWRYLDAAPVETEVPVQWGAYQNDVVGTSVVIGSGRNNTKVIVDFLKKKGELSRAAQVAANLNYEGFIDWFLPSMDELNLMYLNLKNKGIDGFADCYWSSSQSTANIAWHQRFTDGTQFGGSVNTGKIGSNSVRAVRSF